MTEYKGKNHKYKSLIKSPLRLLKCSRKKVAFGCISLTAVGGLGFWRLQTFIHEQLAPLAEKNLTTILNRPILLGEVKEFSLTGVEFGASAIPATISDSDKVTIESVKVGFDPFQLLFNRTLKLDVTLVNPNIYIQQDKQGIWVNTTLKLGKPGALQVDLDKLRVESGKLVLVPSEEKRRERLTIQNLTTENLQSSNKYKQADAPLIFDNLNGDAQLLDNYRLVKLNLRAKSENEENISLSGDIYPRGQKINLDIQGQDLLAKNITRLIPIPLDLQSGKVNGKVNVRWSPEVSPQVYGTADLRQVKLQVPRAPKVFFNARGNLDFDGTKVKLKNVKTSYGKIPLEGSGVIDWKEGYNVNAKVKDVEVNQARDTLNFALPVSAKGVLGADVRLRGKISNPVISGTVRTNKTATLDKVNFRNIVGSFKFTAGNGAIRLSNITGRPTVGGTIRGNGIVQLGEKPRINLNFIAQNIPGDAIAKVYDSTPPVKVGSVNLQAQISGTPSNAITAVNFQAPKATYPTTGQLLVSPDRSFVFRNVRFAYGGGEVVAAGKWNNNRWEAITDVRGVKVKQLISPQQLEGNLANISLDSAKFQGRFSLSGNSKTSQIEKIQPIDAKVKIADGNIRIAQLKLNPKSFSTRLIASGINLEKLFKKATFGIKGFAGGQFDLSGSRDNFDAQTLRGKGSANISIAGGIIKASDISLDEGFYKAKIQTENIKIRQFASNLPTQFQGRLDSKFSIAGSTENFDVNSLKAAGQGILRFGNRAISIPQLQLNGGKYQVKLSANRIPLKEIVPVPNKFRGNLTGQLLAKGSLESFSSDNVRRIVEDKYQQLIAQGRLDFGKGKLVIPKLELISGRYQGRVIAKNLPLSNFVNFPTSTKSALDGEFKFAGSTQSFSPNEIQGKGQVNLRIAGGNVSSNNIEIADGLLRGNFNALEIELAKFNRNLSGIVSGNLQVAANLEYPSLSSTNISGQANFSQGLGGIQAPLKTVFAWNGRKVHLKSAQAENFNASGDIFVNAKGLNIPTITGLNLQVQAKSYSLDGLPLNLPENIKLAGKVDFDGQVTGNLPIPNLQGKLGVKDLAIGKYAFEKYLTGSISSTNQSGLDLNLIGNTDKIAVSLDPKNQPQNFDIQWQQASAKGNLEGDNWKLNLSNFPMGILDLKLPVENRLGPGGILGNLSGDFQYNQDTRNAIGSAILAQPQIGRIKSDRLQADFQYKDGLLSISESSLIKGDSRYSFVGSINPTAVVPEVKGEFKVNTGKIQDILTALQIFEIEDLRTGFEKAEYGRAADLDNTSPVGIPDRPLSMQWRRLSEITKLLEQQEQKRREAFPFPRLATLRGDFNAKVEVDTNTPNGIFLQFDFKGKKFSWGQKNDPSRFYDADTIIASGKLENNILTLQPLSIESKDKLIAFKGNLGGNKQSGQLRVENFPLQILENFIPSPVSLSGKLSGQASLAGNLSNPQARGVLEISDGYFNQKGVKSANASFSYSDSRLNFGSTVGVSTKDPVNIIGSIPYKLPFATVSPKEKDIRLDLEVKNQGLALLNLFTNQLVFETGEGKVDVNVKGTFDRPEVIGIAQVSNATFKSQSLPEKLTEVSGKLQFDFDRIFVENLEGKFSKGNIEVAGEIPIADTEAIDITNPLTVNLNKLALNLKGLYEGGIDGNLQIRGSAFDPKIGGNLLLSGGKILLSESNETPTQIDNNDFSSIKASKPKNTENIENTENINNSDIEDGNVTRFNNLQLTLGKNVEITRPPILTFGATGSLILRGSLNQPQPEGTIKLRGGGVNLFTTQFNLVKGHENTATFRKNQPNDPDLNIQLFAKVLDVIQSSNLGKSNTTGLAALETVRVEANIEGPASKLNENLELVSSPARSETEIVALLGGGFVDTQGRGSSTLGLINIAGSAVFNNFQTAFSEIGTAFGLSELRIFPTLISEDPEAGRNNSSLEIAAEAGIDLNSKISISGIKILTATDPFQWGINYRINNQFRVRGSTNLFDDNRAVIEYQKRF